MVATVKFRSDDFNLTNRNPVSVASLLAATLYQGNHDRNHNEILSFRLWQKDDEVDTIYGTNQGQR
jgi:hypothetical protein